MGRNQRNADLPTSYKALESLPAMSIEDLLVRLSTDHNFRYAVLDIFKICGQDGEDAFQDFFTRLLGWCSEQRQYIIKNPGGWLYASAVHARNSLHSKKVADLVHLEKLARQTAQAHSQAASNPPNQAIGNELSQALLAAVAELRPDASRLFFLRYQGYSFENLAQLFGRNPKAIRAWLSRIRKQLKKLLRPHIDGSSQAAS